MYSPRIDFDEDLEDRLKSAARRNARTAPGQIRWYILQGLAQDEAEAARQEDARSRNQSVAA